MNQRIDAEQLLADALDESGAGGFRAALLHDTLRLASRRRRFRQARRGAAALILIGAVITLVWRGFPPRQGGSRLAMTSCQLVSTHPLSSDAVITSQPFLTSFATTVPGIQVISTATRQGGLHEINDNELLSLAAPCPAALVHTGPHSARLVFANRECAEALLVN